MAEAHHRDVLRHDGIALARAKPRHHLIHCQGDVLAHREPRQQRVVLEHHHLVGAWPLHGFALQQHRAIGGEVQPGNHVEQGALTAAGVANQRDELSFFDLKIDSLQGQVIATTIEGEILGDILNRNK